MPESHLQERKERVAAIIIRDKKVLLVTGHDEKMYWTPGGGIEVGEDHSATLRRELQEELDIECITIEPYFNCTVINEATGNVEVNFYYQVDYRGTPKSCSEITKIYWLSQEEFKQNILPLPKGIRIDVMERLINDELI